MDPDVCRRYRPSDCVVEDEPHPSRMGGRLASVVYRQAECTGSQSGNSPVSGVFPAQGGRWGQVVSFDSKPKTVKKEK